MIERHSNGIPGAGMGGMRNVHSEVHTHVQRCTEAQQRDPWGRHGRDAERALTIKIHSERMVSLSRLRSLHVEKDKDYCRQLCIMQGVPVDWTLAMRREVLVGFAEMLAS